MKLRANEGSAEAALQQARDERLQVGLALEQHIARRQELAEAPPDYAANESRIRELHAELERCEIVIVKRQAGVEEANRQAALASYRRAWKAVESAAEASNAESERLAKHLKAAEASADKLEALRKTLAEQLATARELRPADVEEVEGLADECTWPATALLVRALESGPRRPAAAEAAARERQAHESRRSVDAVLEQAARDALRDGSFVRLSRVPPSELERAVGFAERQARAFLRESAGSRRESDAIERRLERIRALVETSRPPESTPVAVR